MIYTSVSYKGRSRVVLVGDVGRSRANGKPVVLNGMLDGTDYQKTGPYCPIRYDEPKPVNRNFVFEPALNTERQRDKYAKRTR